MKAWIQSECEGMDTYVRDWRVMMVNVNKKMIQVMNIEKKTKKTDNHG